MSAIPQPVQPLPIHLRLLGPVRVELDGEQIGRLESRKALGLLCYLAALGQPALRADLAGIFWPQKSEKRGRGNLSRVLHNIQSELPNFLQTDRNSVGIRPSEEIWIDLHYHGDLTRSGQQHLLVAATELHRGEFLADLSVPNCPDFEQWLLTEREKWQIRMGQLFQSVITHHLERGEYEQGLRHVSHLLELAPWQEEGHRQKMQLLYLSGQRSAALAQFDLCVQILQNEVGAEPSQETVDLYQQIQELNDGLTPMSSITQAGPAQQGLFERGEEHLWLTERWQGARQGLGTFTLLEGEAGLGKTALMEDVLAYAASHGATVLRSRCYDYHPGMTYEAIVSALRPLFQASMDLLSRIALAEPWIVELSRLWPEMQHLATGPALLPEDETTARHRLFEAIAQLLEQTIRVEGELILFLDDLHNADQPTLDLLRYLYHRLHNRAIWFVAAYRREEITPNHPLALLRNVLIREDSLGAISLGRLSGETIYHVVQSYGGLDRAQSQTLHRYLHQESEGNPFVLAQVQRWLQAKEILAEKEGRWHLDTETLDHLSQTDDGVMPEGVQAIFENRLAKLSQRARRLLQTAGVIGRSFDLGTLIQASAEPIDWVEICLASWMARGFVAEEVAKEVAEEVAGRGVPLADHRYQFSHIMLWRVILAELAPLQRQRLEEQIQQVRDGQTAISQENPMERNRGVLSRQRAYHIGDLS